MPHLLIADVERWAERQLHEGPAGREPLRRVLAFLEEAFGRGDPEARGLISVSFLEMLPRPGEPGAGLREMLGDGMRKKLDRIG